MQNDDPLKIKNVPLGGTGPSLEVEAIIAKRQYLRKKKEKGMEEEKRYFYYYRDRNKAPRVTVCLLVTDKAVTRGVAICSLKDNPKKILGRNIAYGRAKKAQEFKNGQYGAGAILRDEALDAMTTCEDKEVWWLYSYKSFLISRNNKEADNIEGLTKYEIRLLGGI